MKIDPKELNAQAGNLAKEATDLNTALTNALNALNGLGGWWGDDEAGRTFYNGGGGGKGYHDQHDNISAEVNAIVTAYNNIAGGLRLMAKNVDTANWNIILSLPKVP